MAESETAAYKALKENMACWPHAAMSNKKAKESESVGCLDFQSSMQLLKEHVPIVRNYLSRHYPMLPEKAHLLKKTCSTHFEKISSYIKGHVQKSYDSLEIDTDMGPLTSLTTETSMETEMTVFVSKASECDVQCLESDQSCSEQEPSQPDMVQGFVILQNDTHPTIE